MKKFRKIMAILVAAVMIVAMAVPAWATSPTTGRLDDLPVAADPDNGIEAHAGTNTGTITINNAEDGETYWAYRILDLYSFTDDDTDSQAHDDPTKEHYAYMINVNSPWYNFIKRYSNIQDTGDVGTYPVYFRIESTDPFTVAESTFTPGSTATNTYHFVSVTDTFKAFADEIGRYDSSDADLIDDGWLTGTTGVANSVQAFAQAAREWASDDTRISAIQNANYAKSITYNTTPGTNTETNNTANSSAPTDKVTIQFTDMRLGYYLVDSSIGRMVALDTTNRDVTMYDKNLSPTIEKQVKLREKDHIKRGAEGTANEGSYGDAKATVLGKNTNFEMGDKVTFVTTITIPRGAGKYADQDSSEFILHDVMEKGFTLDRGSIKVYAKTSNAAADAKKLTGIDAVEGSGTTTKYYEVGLPATTSATRIASENSSFTITFLKPFFDRIVDNATVEVEYEAWINKDAFVVNDNGNTEANETLTSIRAIDEANPSSIEGGPADPGNSTAQAVKQIYADANGDEANTNSAILTYGERSATKWSVATVEVYQFDFVKTKEKKASNGSDTYDLLNGAKFKLYRSTKKTEGTPAVTTQVDTDTPALNDSDVVEFIKSAVDATNHVITYRVKEAAETSETTGYADEIETTSTEKINIRGLEAGTYFLKETYAPDGFQVLDGYIMITIKGDAGSDGSGEAGVTDNDGKITYDYYNRSGTKYTGTGFTDNAALGTPIATITAGSASAPATYGSNGVHVINRTSTELPSTGGMGTTVLYIVGGMLVILAGAYLFFSRKRTA